MKIQRTNQLKNLTKCAVLASLGLMISMAYAQTTSLSSGALQNTTSCIVEPDQFDKAPVVAMEEIPGARPGSNQRVKIVKAQFKYPLVRIEESVEDTPSGREIERKKMTVADHVVVRLRPGTNAKQFARRNKLSVRRKLILPDVYLLKVPATPSGVPDAIKKLETQPEVIFVQADSIAKCNGIPNNSPSFNQQWALHNDGNPYGTPDVDIDAPEAWNYTTGSSSVKVAVIDTGVWYDHPDLAANIGGNDGEIANNGIDDDGNGFIDDTVGWNFVSNDNEPLDDFGQFGHGTSVAGIIGAAGNNGEGGEGVCWSVKMIPIKVVDANGNAVGSSVAEGIAYAVDRGVDIINLSLGGYLFELPQLMALIEASNKNIVVVCAVGNENNNNDNNPSYPSCYNFPNLISVAATDETDHLANVGGWASNYGINTVHLAAPGTSCYAPAVLFQLTATPSYTFFSGTSCATPHVAGVCALVKAANPLLDATQIKADVLQGVDKIPALDGKVATGGRLNALRAVKLACGEEILLPLKAQSDFYTVPFNKKLFVTDGIPAGNEDSVTICPTVLANDSMPVGGNISVSLHSNPNQGGSAAFAVDPNVPASFEYHPKKDFVGSETFEYLLTLSSDSAVGKITITMLPPTAGDDSYKSKNNVITVDDAYGVLENDGFSLDPDTIAEAIPEITAQSLPSPSDTLSPIMDNNGRWTGRFTYTHDPNDKNINVVATFKYHVKFPNAGKVTGDATVTLTTNYFYIPTIVLDEWKVPMPIKEELPSYKVPSYGDGLLKFHVQFPSTDRGTVAITRKPSHGTVTLSSAGQFEYAPRRGAGKADKFQITLSDSQTSRTIQVVIQPQSTGTLKQDINTGGSIPSASLGN